MNKVAIDRCPDYDPDAILEILEMMIEKTGFPDVRDKRILLKPNILSGSDPDKAITTHPALVRAVIRLLKKRGAASVLVGDSPGVGSSDQAGKKAGIAEAVELEGGQWHPFREDGLVPAPEGRKQKQFYLTTALAETDVLISLPKMKTHEMMYFTGAVKNLFGLTCGLKKSRFHLNYPEKEDFAALIVDLLDAVKPDFAIMDGIVAMEGPGPGSGYPRQIGLLLASSNAPALDMAAARIMGYSPEEIPIFREILDRGTWLGSPDEIDYPLLNPEDLLIPDFKRVRVLKDTGFFKKAVPPAVYKAVRNLYVPRPFFKVKPCILCRKCVEICPADALTAHGMKDTRKISIDYSKCIRCYCCHEVCPEDAIRIGRF
jgi:uncharacterized protein (DUF362 family)/Pyruvate/2-oxoacid:ferredoxin oxidoreductase delta subunit